MLSKLEKTLIRNAKAIDPEFWRALGFREIVQVKFATDRLVRLRRILNGLWLFMLLTLMVMSALVFCIVVQYSLVNAGAIPTFSQDTSNAIVNWWLLLATALFLNSVHKSFSGLRRRFSDDVPSLPKMLCPLKEDVEMCTKVATLLETREVADAGAVSAYRAAVLDRRNELLVVDGLCMMALARPALREAQARQKQRAIAVVCG